MESIKTIEHTKTLIDHILSNSLEKVIQSGVIEIGLSSHKLITEHYKMPFRSMKNYSDQIFVDKSRLLKLRH